jgi:hypothetical protein
MWETNSLEWIHKVREEMDEEIRRKGITPTQWIKTRGQIDMESLCHKLGLKYFTIVQDKGRALPKEYSCKKQSNALSRKI